ncbi:LPS O-antigen length regulator [Kluyvera ascorbata]|uniref:LPS O-antigen length regulator n=1 Tax=Kluyvera ascorbata TaxID=51288 RepID=A0A3N2SA70_9ENTR|nr:LPS O-antigen length regulator Wzz(fepE) [Kluyvera ascorbata]ROU16615.1 LPS O-antigen length regulator [Kluyvera ascorbata]
MSIKAILQPDPVGTLQVTAASNDEIDLRLLLLQLSHAKKIITAFVVAAAIFSLALVFMLPQKWTSKAVVTMPESVEVANLDHVVIQMKTLGVPVQSSRKATFDLFIKKLSSQSQFQEWLRSSGIIENIVDPVELHRKIVDMAEGLKITNNMDPKTPIEQMPYVGWTLQFTGAEPEQAQAILRGYLEHISAEVRKEVLLTMRNSIDKQISAEKASLALERTHLENVRNILIQRLKYSLSIANAAGIQKPMYSEGLAVKDDPDFSISLGAAGIAEKLKIESSLQDVSTLNSALQNREYNLQKLQSLTIPDVDFMPVAYQLSPTLPIKKDGPGNALILLLGCLLGGVLGCGYVLGRQAFRA